MNKNIRVTHPRRLYRSVVRAGADIVEGDDIMRLYKAVASQLTIAETFGEPYPFDCLAINIAQVNEDIDSGLIAEPKDHAGWAEVIVAVYRDNISRLTPEAEEAARRLYGGARYRKDK